ncbi:MAG: hypothetical protein K2X86_04900 [Cytophagaceae bacterium]|nr:hypothetical protein [Cytophagaceae bacterium]
MLKIKILYAIILAVISGSCTSSKKNAAVRNQELTGEVEFVITPVINDTPIYFDSLYNFPGGEKFQLKVLKLYLSEIALSRSTGVEYKSISDEFRAGVFLADLVAGNIVLPFL